jgi:hypothetical protein
MKSPENKEKPNKSEQKPREVSKATKRALGRIAIKAGK